MYLLSKKGFTFAECLLALVILGVALAPLLLCFPTGAKQGRLAKKMSVATDLAMDLVDEIKKMAFEEPGTSGSFGLEAGEGPTRINFDDVDDYDTWKIESPPEDMNGNTLPDFIGYTRSVTIINVTEGDLNNEAPGGDGSTDFKKVKVTVSEQDISDIELVTVVTKY